jgi:hypothetical protein
MGEGRAKLSKSEFSEIRKQAWRTRREMYGDRGHAGGYLRPGESERFGRMVALIVKLHVEDVLSEGQVAKATGYDRIRVRQLADEEMHRREERLHQAAMAREYGPVTPSAEGGE